MKDIEERNKEWKTTRKKGRKEWRERDKESKLTLAPEWLFSLVFLRLATVGHSYILPGRSFSLDLSGFLGTKISEISESFPFTIKKVALNICRLTSWGMLCNSLHPVLFHWCFQYLMFYRLCCPTAVFMSLLTFQGQFLLPSNRFLCLLQYVLFS